MCQQRGKLPSVAILGADVLHLSCGEPRLRRDADAFEAGELRIRVVEQLPSICRPAQMVWRIRTVAKS